MAHKSLTLKQIEEDLMYQLKLARGNADRDLTVPIYAALVEVKKTQVLEQMSENTEARYSGS